jgi:hypothetical protein
MCLYSESLRPWWTQHYCLIPSLAPAVLAGACRKLIVLQAQLRLGIEELKLSFSHFKISKIRLKREIVSETVVALPSY